VTQMTKASMFSGALLGVIGCAPAAGTGSEPAPNRVLATSDAVIFSDHTRIINPSVHVEARPDSVFKLLRTVYREVGIEVSGWNPATGQIGNGDFARTGTLGGVVLHQFVGCGTTMTGFVADSYHVQFSVISKVAAEGAGSNVETSLNARAQDRGAGMRWSSCLTTGILETRINRLLAEKVKG
jgi:hypothetical protein